MRKRFYSTLTGPDLRARRIAQGVKAQDVERHLGKPQGWCSRIENKYRVTDTIVADHQTAVMAIVKERPALTGAGAR